MRTSFLLGVIAAALLSSACQTGNDDPTPSDTAAAPGHVRIVKGEHGPAYPDAKLAITSPASNEVVTGDSVYIKADLSGIELSSPTVGEQSKGINFSKEGQHVHVIIDNEPYKAMYATEKFNVGHLAEGMHTIRAFPSRSWHESVKVPAAFVMHTFYVGKKTADSAMKTDLPLLTYSRPKGEYKGDDANRILLDFFVTNAELGADKYKVLATIDGAHADTLSEWVPYFIEGLADGEHTIKLQLIDPSGNPVDGAYNTTERKITVARGGTAPDPHSAGAH